VVRLSQTLGIAKEPVRLRNPFQSPASNLEPESQPGKTPSLPTIVRSVALTWVVVAPIIWWQTFSMRFGVHPELAHMLQPVALAALGILAFPLVWRPYARASIALVALSIIIASSTLLFSTVFTDGTIINSGLLSLVGVTTWLQSRMSRASRDA